MNISHKKIAVSLAALLATVSVEAQVKLSDKSSEKIDLGFGVEQTEFLSTVSAAVISGEELRQTSATSLADALYGRLLGLAAFQQGGFVGDEGNGAAFHIRGNQTFSDKNILILVDGFERPIDRLTVEEVESVTVLKDAAALAMLGHEAVNGAILVKTKRGKVDKTHIKVGYSHKFSFDPEFAPMLDAFNYASALNRALVNDGSSKKYSDDELALFKSGTDPHFYPNVNWKNEALKKFGNEDRANISVFGGTDKVRYYSMIDYTDVRGLLKNTKQELFNSQLRLSKANIRANVDFDISPTTKMSVNVLGIFMETNRPNGTNANDVAWNIYATPAGAFPYKTSEGVWGGNEAYTDRNIAGKIQDSGFAKTHQRQLWADARLTQDMSFWVKGLSVFLAAGYDNSSITTEWRSKGYQWGYEQYLGTIGDKENVKTVTQGNRETKLGFYDEVTNQWRVANSAMGIDYKTSFRGDDHFAASILYTTKSEVRDRRHNTFNRANWIGNFHYDLKDKFIVDLSLAANGSNRNYPAKWAFSPVVSLGWIYANNPEGGFTYGKLRASAGVQHTDYQPIPWMDGDNISENVIWQEVWNAGHGDFVYGTQFSNTWGTFIDAFPSRGYSQERALKYNLGTEIRLWNALDLTAEGYYQRRSHIMLPSSELNSQVVGIRSSWSDVGKVDSYGVEVGAKFAKKVARDLWINVGGMVTWGRSKIVANIENPAYPNLSEIGSRVDEARGLRAIGFFADQADIDASPLQEFSQVRPGDIKYKDINGDGVINQNDFVALGSSDGLAALNYAFNVGIEYKGIGINALFQGIGSTMKNQRWVTGVWRVLADNRNLSTDYYNNSWDVAGENALFPRLTAASNPNNEQDSDLWYKKVHFLKLRSCEVYYKLPSRLCKRARLSEAKIFVQGENLLSFDNVKAMDAELFSTTFPTLKSVNVGISLTF